MAWGVVETEHGMIAATMRSRSAEADAIRVHRLEDGTTEPLSGPVVFGCGLHKCFVQQVPLPDSSRRELKEAIDLQVEFHLPYEREQAWASQHLTRTSGGHLLRIVATGQRVTPPLKAVVPAPFGLLGLARLTRQTDTGKATLLLLADGARVTSLLTEHGEVAFMRSFQAGDDPVDDLRLSAQRVYDTDERCLVQPDGILLYGCAERYVDAAHQITDRVDVVAVDALLPDRTDDSSDEAPELTDALLALGLAVVAKHPELASSWNMLQVSNPWGAVTRRALRVAALIVPVAALAGLHAAAWIDSSRVASEREALSALLPTLQEVADLEREVALFEAQLTRNGDLLRRPETWQRLFQELAEQRPRGLYLTSVSGRPGGALLIAGHAGDHDAAADHVQRIRRMSSLTDLELVFTQASDRGVDFQLVARFVEGSEI